MTTDKPQDPTDQERCGTRDPQDPGCDPQLVDAVACEASGVAAQAEYNASYAEALAKAKTDYDQARKDYRAKHHEVALQVQDRRHEIKRLLERIRCLIKQKRVWRCIDGSFCEVVEELECCYPPDAGCCVEECDFETEGAPGWSHIELAKRIVKYQADTDAAKACFDSLVGETAALQARVDQASAEVDAVNEALAADPATTDLKRVYAQALVAQRDLALVWGGFEETHQYVDCLCRALTCWTKGCAAVSVLTGALAVVECQEAATAARCESLRTNTVDEILAVYDKRCGHKPCDDGDGGDGDDGCDDRDDCDDDHGHGHGDDDDDDCGCHHHHHERKKHNHHHHHDCGCGGSDKGSDNGGTGEAGTSDGPVLT